MRTLLIATTLLLVTGTAVAGKAHLKHDARAEHRLHMQLELALSDEQIEQMREIRNNGGSREEVRAVLTPEQQEKMKEIRQSHKGMSERRLAKMQTFLDLSDEQLEQMKEIREQGGKRKEMFAVLTQEQQAKLRHKRRKLSTGG